MTNFIAEYYLWIKALHIIAVISWMAGLLYLPRLFVYHVGAKKGGELSETLKVMERKLYRYIMNPAMILSLIFGGLMFYAIWASGGLAEMKWLHSKLTLVFLLIGYHHMLGAYRKKFLNDANTKTAKFYKIMNEVPTTLMILIVILAVAKPF